MEDLGINSVSVLKIDVEGAEVEVLDGLRKTIAEKRPFIICEILPVGDDESKVGKMRRKRTDAVTTLLSSLKYEILRQLDDGTCLPLKKIETHDDLGLCNYLFVPKESMEAVLGTLVQENHSLRIEHVWKKANTCKTEANDEQTGSRGRLTKLNRGSMI